MYAATRMDLKKIMLRERSPDTKGYILCNSIYVTFWIRQHYSDRNQINGCQRSGKGIDVKETQRTRGRFGVLEMFYIEIVVVIKHLNAFVKSH